MSIPIIQYIIALSIGMSTGLVLQRGRVCTNSAFRNLFLIRNGELSTIIPVAVAVTVTGYFLLTLMPGYEFISNPIHFSFIFLPIGAFIFGLGTVFASGCAGGVCYRVGEGNVKSLIALLGFISGIGILATGIVAEVFQSLNSSSLILINNQTPSLEQFAPRSIWTIRIKAAVTIKQRSDRNRVKGGVICQ